MKFNVTCTTKHASYERITHLGCVSDTGIEKRFTEDEAIDSIKQGNNFHVTRDGHTAKVIIAEHEGREYLKTERDGTRADNLLSLPHCMSKIVPVTPPTRTYPAPSHSV